MSLRNCPVKVTVDVIGGKWKPLILYFLKDKPQRFNALERLMPEATRKMLTQQLRELEADEIVERKVLGRVPPHVEYSMSAHGKTLQSILDQMASWGIEHHDKYQRQRRRTLLG
jgi:DNA-binding HxlR family transcriptional regulator